MSTVDPSRRVRVTAPETVSGRPRAPRTALTEIDAQSEGGEIFVRSLLRAQLSQAVLTLTWLALAVGGLPLLFHFWPGLAERELFGMPLAWGFLAFAIYPILVVIGIDHVRRAERTEREFTDVVEGS